MSVLHKCDRLMCGFYTSSPLVFKLHAWKHGRVDELQTANDSTYRDRLKDGTLSKNDVKILKMTDAWYGMVECGSQEMDLHFARGACKELTSDELRRMIFYMSTVYRYNGNAYEDMLVKAFMGDKHEPAT